MMERGDLIFLLCDGSEFSKAIVAASAPELLLDHVGIVDETEQGFCVIEANSKLGVVATPLSDFISRAPKLENDKGWRLRRLPDDSGVNVRRAVEMARGRIGEAYNWRFVPTKGALYCSELVQKCYLRNDGSPFFKSIRMDFDCDDVDCRRFWQQHFASLGMAVPQGEEGTSPLSVYEQTIETDSIL